MTSQETHRGFKSNSSQRTRPSGGTQNTSMSLSPMTSRLKKFLQKEFVRDFLAEFLSTYVMMVFGLGSVAHWVLSDNLGSYLGVNLGFGFGVTMGIHIAGNISGAHMNSAITFASCAMGRLSWRKFPFYVLGQFLGSFLASVTIFLLFYSAIMRFSQDNLAVTGPLGTAGIFATYLPDHMTLWRGFLSELIVTGMLQLCILAITDKKNTPALQGTHAMVIGILVVTIGISLGMNSGYAINPSRDLPPRFFTFIAGWGKEVFSNRNWWWVPLVAPMLGAYLGALVYLAFIESGFPQAPELLQTPKVYTDYEIPVPSKNQGTANSGTLNSTSNTATVQVQSVAVQTETYTEPL